jgi:hypothetical protein
MARKSGVNNIGGKLPRQDDIASDISGQLRLKLSGEEKKRVSEHGTENSDAYQLYVKGRY